LEANSFQDAPSPRKVGDELNPAGLGFDDAIDGWPAVARVVKRAKARWETHIKQKIQGLLSLNRASHDNNHDIKLGSSHQIGKISN